MEGRLANLSTALWLGTAADPSASPEREAEVAGWLAALSLDLLVVGACTGAPLPGRALPDATGTPSVLRSLASLLAAASCEHVLVVAAADPLASPELLLALAAWPDTAMVMPRSEDGRAHPLCARYEREAALAAARQGLATGERTLDPLLTQLECQELSGSDLAALIRPLQLPAGTGGQNGTGGRDGTGGRNETGGRDGASRNANAPRA